MQEKDWLIRLKNMLEIEKDIAQSYDNEVGRQSLLMLNMFLVQIKQRIKFIARI